MGESLGYTDASVKDYLYNGDGTTYRTYICPSHMLHLGEQYLLKVNTGAIYRATAYQVDTGEFVWVRRELLLGADIPTGTTGIYGKAWEGYDGPQYSGRDGAPIALFSGCNDRIVRAWFCRINGTRT